MMLISLLASETGKTLGEGIVKDECFVGRGGIKGDPSLPEGGELQLVVCVNRHECRQLYILLMLVTEIRLSGQYFQLAGSLTFPTQLWWGDT